MNTFNRVEKTADRITIKNKGRDLYTQYFTTNDGNCRVATHSVKHKFGNTAERQALLSKVPLVRSHFFYFYTILCGCLSAIFMQILLICQRNKLALKFFGLFLAQKPISCDFIRGNSYLSIKQNIHLESKYQFELQKDNFSTIFQLEHNYIL